MADGDQRSDVRHAPRQIHDGLGRDTADACRPLRVLFDAILASQQISLEAWIACRIAVEKFPVMPSLVDEDEGDCEHERDIGSGDDRQPFSLQIGGEIILEGAYEDKTGAAGTGTTQRGTYDVPADTAAVDIGVLDRHAAEGNDQLAAALDRLPGDALSVEAIVRTEHMRNDDHRRARTVGIDRSDISAKHVEKTMDLALGMMKASCAGPAIRAAENRLRSGFVVNAAKLVGDKIERFRPADLHITVAPTFPGIIRLAFKPAAPDGRPPDAGGAVGDCGQISEQGRWMRVGGMRTDFERFALVAPIECTPMRAVGFEVVHRTVSRGKSGKIGNSHTGRILPGFMMPLGSMACFSRAISSTASPCSWRR
ncbi:UNVERIFIED_ORG: hypothetical protein GGE63_005091 [Rhizobium esperanzae]